MIIFIDHLPYLLSLLAGFAVALLIGSSLFVRGRDRLPAERLSLLLCPAAALVMLTLAVNKIVQAPDNDWNGARLVPLVGLRYGAEMYVGPEGPGAIMNTIYPPLSYLVYIPSLLFSNPTCAIIAGSCTSAVLYFSPPAFLSFSLRKDDFDKRVSLLGIAVAIGFLQAVLNSKALCNAGFMIHADAPMMGFTGLACLLLYRNRGRTDLPRLTCLISATCAAMAVWSKQTALSMVAALPLWVLLTCGFRTAVRYTSYLLAMLAAFSLVFWRMLDVESFLFNIFGIPSKHPWFYQAPDLARTFLVLSAEYFCVIVALLASILLTLFARRRLTPPGESESETSGLRQWVGTNNWSLFLLVAFASIPTSLLGRVKMGGHWNSYAPVPYFLGLGLIALLMEWYATNRRRGLRSFNASLTLVVLLLVVSPLTRGDESFAALNTVHPPSMNAQDIAYQYALRHPGTAYFPWNPLSSLLAEGRLYHFEFGMHDRELAGYPVSQRHFRQNIPASMRYVCFPGHYKPFGKRFEETLRYLPEFRRRVEIEELPGWTCYER